MLLRLREWLQREVAPIANDQWARAEFPHDLVPRLGELGVIGLGYDRPGRPAASRLLTSFVTLEISRVDTSLATFFGVHSGLAMGSIVLLGSDEQRERWLPDMFALRTVGAFALTEPDGGSDVALGLKTTARREGDEWVLDGEKRWIGNATFADLVVVWARDVADDTVKGFVVQQDNPGFTATKMEGKLALRSVQNADIVLRDCRVPDADKLAGANTFKDTGRVLQLTRGGVAWNSVGCQMGAYEAALAYAKQREQFGRPIGGFQLVQDLLVKMLGNITASLGPDGARRRAAGGGPLHRRAGGARQGLLHEPHARDRGVRPRGARRQRHPARARRRPVLQRRRGAVLLRGHPRDQHAHRRPRHHGQQRLRLPGAPSPGAPARGAVLVGWRHGRLHRRAHRQRRLLRLLRRRRDAREGRPRPRRRHVHGLAHLPAGDARPRQGRRQDPAQRRRAGDRRRPAHASCSRVHLLEVDRDHGASPTPTAA